MDNTYAIIKDGKVDNIVLWDGVTEWTPPEGSIVVLVPDGEPLSTGDLYDAETGFTRIVPNP